MYCRYCGNELDENGFCENCGIEFENHQQPPVVYVNTQQKESVERKEPRTSGMAVAGFIMAILQFFLSGNISVILALLAIIFSFVGMSHTKNGKISVDGFAESVKRLSPKKVKIDITLTPFILGFIEGYLLARGY